MKNFFCISVIFLSFLACDDGDIIVTDFDFEDTPLERCGGIGEYVFFKRNDETLETLSLQLRTQDTLFGTIDTTAYNLDGTNNVVHYRTYATEVGSDYFCSSVPPTSPTVNQNYIGDQGTVTVSRTLINGENTEDTIGFFPIVTNDTILVSIKIDDLVLDNGEETLIRETLELGEFEYITD